MKEKKSSVVDPIKRLGMPTSTLGRIRKQAIDEKFTGRPEISGEDWRTNMYRELEWLRCIEEAAAKELEGVFTREEWLSMVAAYNGHRVGMPRPVERDEVVDCRMPDDLADDVTEWARWNAEEAAQFGDPAVLASTIAQKLSRLSYAARYLIVRLLLESWGREEKEDILEPMTEAGALGR